MATVHKPIKPTLKINISDTTLEDACVVESVVDCTVGSTRYTTRGKINFADLYRCGAELRTMLHDRLVTELQQEVAKTVAVPATYLAEDTGGTYASRCVWDSTVDLNTSNSTPFSCTTAGYSNNLWTTGMDSNGIYWTYGYKPNEKTKFLNKIRNNLQIRIKSRADIIKGIPENEAKAIETLRDEISEKEYRKYVKYGFVLVPGKSGKLYQIFRNRWHTKVWKGGKLVEEVCVRIGSEANVPPTDNVIAFKAMIEANEENFRKMGNVYKMDEAA